MSKATELIGQERSERPLRCVRACPNDMTVCQDEQRRNRDCSRRDTKEHHDETTDE